MSTFKLLLLKWYGKLKLNPLFPVSALLLCAGLRAGMGIQPEITITQSGIVMDYPGNEQMRSPLCGPLGLHHLSGN